MLRPSAATSPPDPASKPAVEQQLLALPNELLARRVANRKRRHVDKITARYTRADQLIGQGRISTAVSHLHKGEVQLTPDEQLAAMTAAHPKPASSPSADAIATLFSQSASPYALPAVAPQPPPSPTTQSGTGSSRLRPTATS
ncbi:hypothetical protein PAPYR_10422 [Paratrimastix pyriformis]|uniref:Uncharacterized protein n=1 Tax=Paratrimastix pyriformis TaxID=342808 RepID=A0ABQ8UBR5_9EUKA|nr:hypothetical protein PAPYR_10422 [Paratrimastix pyriformis]